jgi:archaeosortase B (VPXXXP-CTERM-specific)
MAGPESEGREPGAPEPEERRWWPARIWGNPAYRFALLFMLYLGVISYVYPQVRLRYPSYVNGMARFTAYVEYWLLDLFSEKVSISGLVVIFGGFSVKIIEECTGVYEVMIFSAAVLAFPTRLRAKVIGLAVGAPILYAFNVLRIAFLLIVGRYYPSVFDFAHLYFMQATLILMITSVWLLWIFKVVRRSDEPLGAPA